MVLKKSYPAARIIKDYESGMTCKKLEEKYGCAPSTISNRLRAEGVKIRSAGKNNLRYYY